MKLHQLGPILALSGSLASCFWRTEKSPDPTPAEAQTPRQMITKLAPTPAEVKKDRSLEIFAKAFEQADAIHREAWWVLTNDRRPSGKSPFGKVQRAIQSSEGIKLANKSAFRCDRYIMKRDILAATGFPQRLEVFEKCQEKIEAKKLAQVQITSKTEFEAVFYPENLEEILGLGPAVLNRSIRCSIKSNDSEQMESLKCTDWAQDRSQNQMIRLDTYEYVRAGKNLIKLRGKVYENLTDTRKIEADVPMEGKIVVKETELYPPEAPPAPKPTPTPAPKKAAKPPEQGDDGWPEGVDPNAPATEQAITPLISPDGVMIPPPRGATAPAVDPDVLMQQQQQQEMHPEGVHIENGEVVNPEGAITPQGHPETPQEDVPLPQPQVPQREDPAGGVYGR